MISVSEGRRTVPRSEDRNPAALMVALACAAGQIE